MMRSEDMIEERLATLQRLYEDAKDPATHLRLDAAVRTLQWVLGTDEDDL